MKSNTKTALACFAGGVAFAAFLFAGIGIAFPSQTEAQPPVEIIEEVQQAEEIAVEPETTVEVPEPTYKSLGIYTATAYCPCAKCCGKTDGITATGTKATAGRTIAVDPTDIPYGTSVIIDGHTYLAEDCGGVIKGKKIDIFFDSHTAALEYGRRKVEVFVKV